MVRFVGSFPQIIPPPHDRLQFLHARRNHHAHSQGGGKEADFVHLVLRVSLVVAVFLEPAFPSLLVILAAAGFLRRGFRDEKPREIPPARGLRQKLVREGMVVRRPHQIQTEGLDQLGTDLLGCCPGQWWSCRGTGLVGRRFGHGVRWWLGKFAGSPAPLTSRQIPRGRSV